MVNRKLSRRAFVVSAALGLPWAGAELASANINIQTVPVGDVGNFADPNTGFGEVDYAYNIGKYDVTSSQYCAFLNAVASTDTYGIYHPNMAGTTSGNPGIVQSGSPGNYTYSVIDGRGNIPVTDVSFWNCTRFANWLNNGQPNGPEGAGTTETGAYNLLATSMDAALAATPNQKYLLQTDSADNNAVQRTANATWAVTSENEWYKAAYYTPSINGSGSPGYYLSPGQAVPTNNGDVNTDSNDTTPVGTYYWYTTYYGTFDQGGDVYQWNEGITNGYNVRDMRGGAWDCGGDWGRVLPTEGTYQMPWETFNDTGFRVTELGGLTSLSLTWNNSSASGDGTTWDVGGNQNWNNGAPGTVYSDGTNVTFNDNNNGHYNVALNMTVAPMSVTVNAAGNYAISGSGTIGGSGSLTQNGTGTLQLSTVNSYSGGTIVNAGTLVAGVSGALPSGGSVTINGNAVVKLAAGSGLQTISTLTLAQTATFDIENNHVLISDTPGTAATTISELKQGRASNFAGPGGIISSTAAALSSYGVAFGEGGVIPGIPSGEIELSFTLYGDINQDGVVNGTDLGILAAHFGHLVTGGWEQGDFDYSGTVDGTDFALLARNFGQSATGRSVALPSSVWAALDTFAASHGLLADVPEPASGALLAVGVGAMLRRRRRA
jgi:formylglycine-generating enzyme